MGRSIILSIMFRLCLLLACLAGVLSQYGVDADPTLGGAHGGSIHGSGLGGLGDSLGASFGGFDGGFGGRAGGQDTIVVTHTRTIDEIVTRVSTVYNSLPITQTDFVLQTVTSQTYQVIRTPGNDDVRISTVAVVQPVVEQVVDVLHEVQDVHFVTVTRTVQEEIVVTEHLVQTQVVTDYNLVTDYRYVTHYEYVQAGGKSGGFANDFANEFGHGSNGNFGSGYAY